MQDDLIKIVEFIDMSRLVIKRIKMNIVFSTNSWHTTYRNKFVKVTNLSNTKSIVVKVTDIAPANRGIELSYRAWVSIGKPSSVNSVKIELMAN